MLVITSRKFREKQGEYLDLVAKGQDVVIKSRNRGSFRLVRVREDDTVYSKQEFYDKLDRSLEQIKSNQSISKEDGETSEQFIERLLCTE